MVEWQKCLGHRSGREEYRGGTPRPRNGRARAWLPLPHEPSLEHISLWEQYPAPLPGPRGCVLCVSSARGTSQCHSAMLLRTKLALASVSCCLVAVTCRQKLHCRRVVYLETHRPGAFEEPQIPEFRRGPPSTQVWLHYQIRPLWPHRWATSNQGTGRSHQGSPQEHVSCPRVSSGVSQPGKRPG